MRPLIIGERADPHVISVESVLENHGVQSLILDLESVMSNGISIGENGCRVRVDGEYVDPATFCAGWVRRFNRPGWGVGVQAGSLRALELGAWHSSYSWLLDHDDINWITSPSALRRGESKLRQWEAARALEVPYPRTLVTSDRNEVVSTFNGEVIVKPLGTGQYLDGGNTKTVFAEPLMPTDERLWALEASPFIVQERLRASKHLRVVTVGDEIWVASFRAGLNDSADWRKSEQNHSRFQVEKEVHPTVARGSRKIATHMQLGYSSQDWVETSSGEMFLLDVNPAGQWLFLPETIGLEIAEAIANSLINAT